ncbi:MAG: hypothetical protein AAF649_09750 [Verrucomicrobiota bacterium]
MSKKKAEKSSGCCTGSSCSCSSESKPEAAPAASAAETSASSASQSSTIQNGKGSAPRNMGPTFKKNFGKIKWGDKRERVEGRREVKVYG